MVFSKICAVSFEPLPLLVATCRTRQMVKQVEVLKSKDRARWREARAQDERTALSHL